jgi:hypothetical protein
VTVIAQYQRTLWLDMEQTEEIDLPDQLNVRRASSRSNHPVDGHLRMGPIGFDIAFSVWTNRTTGQDGRSNRRRRASIAARLLVPHTPCRAWPPSSLSPQHGRSAPGFVASRAEARGAASPHQTLSEPLTTELRSSASGCSSLMALAALSRKNALMLVPIRRTWRESSSYSSGRSLTIIRTVRATL